MIVKEVLDNGLTLITEEMPSVRSVAVGVWVAVGVMDGVGVGVQVPMLGGTAVAISNCATSSAVASVPKASSIAS